MRKYILTEDKELDSTEKKINSKFVEESSID